MAPKLAHQARPAKHLVGEELPSERWVTDVTEFKVENRKLY